MIKKEGRSIHVSSEAMPDLGYWTTVIPGTEHEHPWRVSSRLSYSSISYEL